jgi:hypothetical protein
LLGQAFRPLFCHYGQPLLKISPCRVIGQNHVRKKSEKPAAVL